MSESLSDEKVKLARRMSEKDLAAQVVDTAKTLNLLRYHTYRSTRSPSGFPDEVIVGPGGCLFRELKREGEKPTVAQQKWLAGLSAAGEDADVWRPSDWYTGRILAEMTMLRHPRRST